jgi:hypothetical protein
MQDWEAIRMRRRTAATSLTPDELKADLKEVKDDLARNDPQYAPENYFCDGEITPAEAHARWQGWLNRKAELEREIERRTR